MLLVVGEPLRDLFGRKVTSPHLEFGVAVKWGGKGMALGIQWIWIYIPGLPLVCCVMLYRLLDLSMSFLSL